jgi:hypothetical protein
MELTTGAKWAVNREYGPLNYVHVRTDCTDFLCPENRAQLLPRFLCQLMLYNSLRMHANIRRKNAAAVLDFCAHLMLYDLQKSVRYGLFFLVVCWLEKRACSLPWDACSPPANVVSLLQLDLSLFLSCSLNKNA